MVELDISSDYVKKVEEELEEVLDSILENNEGLNQLQEIKTIADWYREAKEDPYKIPSIISNKIIEHMLEYVKPYFTSLLLENISIESKVRRNGVKFDLDFSLKPIRPYVELAKAVNGVEVPPPIRLTFQIDTDVNIQDLQINSSPEGKAVDLEKLVIALNLSIVKLPFIHINKPLVLGEQEFEVNKLSFHLPS